MSAPGRTLPSHRDFRKRFVVGMRIVRIGKRCEQNGMVGRTARRQSADEPNRMRTTAGTMTIQVKNKLGRSSIQMSAVEHTRPGAKAVVVESKLVTVGESNTVDIRRMALVSRDYWALNSNGRCDYSEYFNRINASCDAESCDAVLYSLYTWDTRSTIERNHDMIFACLKQVSLVILETYEFKDGEWYPCVVETWRRGKLEPFISQQCFATSADHRNEKQRFIRAFDSRQIGNALLMICGETNIAKTIRGSDEFNDSFGFNELLSRNGVRLIFNPIHDYMRRYEMREKRRYYSLEGRTIVSVWNIGKGNEPRLPWSVFHDGDEWTDQVHELQPIPERPDIRVGIVDLP
jgi:hypothetical protein